jgi:hypothetical protein
VAQFPHKTEDVGFTASECGLQLCLCFSQGAVVCNFVKGVLKLGRFYTRVEQKGAYGKHRILPGFGRKWPLFGGLFIKSTRWIVFCFQNGTTIALMFMQLLGFTQHPMQCESKD